MTKERDMSANENNSQANKPKREKDYVGKNDLPYDPNINQDDKQALNPKGHSMNRGQDKPLAERKRPVDFAGGDLDIPGRNERDMSNESSGLPDEENFQFKEQGTRSNTEKAKDHPNPDRKIP